MCCKHRTVWAKLALGANTIVKLLRVMFTPSRARMCLTKCFRRWCRSGNWGAQTFRVDQYTHLQQSRLTERTRPGGYSQFEERTPTPHEVMTAAPKASRFKIYLLLLRKMSVLRSRNEAKDASGSSQCSEKLQSRTK